MGQLKPHKRILIETGLDPGIWGAGHGGDEYGNCSVYLRTPIGGIVFFWDTHYQDDIELPYDDVATVDDWQMWYEHKFFGTLDA